jgi:hypothetical protein
VISVRELLRRNKPNVALLLVGVLIGALLIPPVAAHVGGTINHLWGAPNHLKKKVQTFSDARYPRFGGVLPKGKMQVGAWYGLGDENASSIAASISYPVPLNFNPTAVVIPEGESTIPTGCSGSATTPRADPGFLCIFETYSPNTGEVSAYSAESANIFCNNPPPSTPVCRRGAVLFATKGMPAPLAEMAGTYAVTAPTS